MSSRGSLYVATLLLAFAAGRVLAASLEQDDSSSSAPVAGGTLAWIFSDDLDLVGDMRLDFPFAVSGGNGGFFRLDARTEIRKASSGFSFDVRDVGYAFDLGGRHSLRTGPVVSAFVGQWGKEFADTDGEPYLRYAAVGIESEDYRTGNRARGLEWRATAGGVLDHQEIKADVVLRGDLRWNLPWERVGFGVDLGVDALIGPMSRADLSLGPRLDLFSSGPPVTSLFVHYFRDRTPLGLETSGFLVGADYCGTTAGRQAVSPPEIRGSLGLGGGGGREAGRFDLLLLSPALFPASLRRAAWVVGEFELNTLTATDTGDLYYLYRVGVEGRAKGGIAGGYFYHRSNHRLAEAASTPFTAINVLEVGYETTGWRQAPASLARSAWGRLDARVRVGWLRDTNFGMDGRAHGSAGLRWMLPWPIGRALPYVVAHAEDGQVGRCGYGIGVATPLDLDFGVEYRSDEQLYARDKTALLLTCTLPF